MDSYKIILDNGTQITINNNILEKSSTLKEMYESTLIKDFTINLTGVNRNTFSHIITILKYMELNPEDKDFVKNFLNNMTVMTLFDFIIMVKNLKIDCLMDIGKERFFNIFNTSVDNIRKEFELNDDFTLDEKNDLIDNYGWEEEPHDVWDNDPQIKEKNNSKIKKENIDSNCHISNIKKKKHLDTKKIEGKLINKLS